MQSRVLIKPAEDYFVAFLATRGINLCTEQPNVVHYFGKSKHELKKLVSEHNPDLVVINNKKVFDLNYPFSFALDHIGNDKEIYSNHNVTTNAPELTKLYYRGLGLDRTINDCSEIKKKKDRLKLKIRLNSVKKFFTVMMWD